MPPLRLLFLGSDPIALPTLNRLLATEPRRVEIVAVYTQPDRPHGRGQRTLPGPIKEWAVARGFPVFQPERLDGTDVERVRALHIDAALVMAYGQILKEDFLGAPRLGVFNLHTSVLPRYRGASPVAGAIASGETGTGVSFMRVVRQLDAGPVAAVAPVAIGARDTTATVEAALGEAAAALTERCLAALGEGTLPLRDQDPAQASFCRRLEKADGVLDFTRPAAEVARRVNALQPWPGCAVELAGQTVKIGLAEARPEAVAATPGTVLPPEADALPVAATGGVVRLLRLQRPGGKMLPAADFLRGFDLPAGTVIPSAPMPPLVSPVPFPRKRRPE